MVEFDVQLSIVVQVFCEGGDLKSVYVPFSYMYQPGSEFMLQPSSFAASLTSSVPRNSLGCSRVGTCLCIYVRENTPLRRPRDLDQERRLE